MLFLVKRIWKRDFFLLIFPQNAGNTRGRRGGGEGRGGWEWIWWFGEISFHEPLLQRSLRHQSRIIWYLSLSLSYIHSFSLSFSFSYSLSLVLSHSIIHTHTFTRSSLLMIPHLIPSQSLPFLFNFVFLFLPQTLHRFWILFQWTCVWPSLTNTSELPPNRETSYEWREKRENEKERE